ncbi:alpha-L-rhamnosidase C-terminal domain-containing protein [[Flexibacter] sp. ATCC 35208]|uniref:alpha-L-rhamnosidase-related protein n=1 Tax=[Flexibacter] sp. ATCC 35208 TaxID=1936242 RepID=UPI0009D06E04|nr:alpha-L-rhamnosidase C-terminal domain-containing protein [[Flexibacter] sp. ATCC 35208]OMP75774.1 alpha-rhamnosidase [[Flexibacter] sp. ATCC 35208]
MKLLYTLFSLTVLCSQLCFGQHTRSWNSQWIGLKAPFDNGKSYGVCYFRRSIDLSERPQSFIIHASADNRYKLYVNGQLVSIGPAKGDFYNWNYETIDLAPYLTKGKNSIAAIVWNEAEFRPEWQMTLRTAFIIQGNTPAEDIINTNDTWKCVQDKAFSPLWGFFAATNGEIVDMNKTIPNWQAKDFDDSGWPPAGNLFQGQLKGAGDGFGYMLVPSTIPARELTYQPVTVIRKGAALPATIPANTETTILLDQTYETNAYPTICFSGGKDAGISLSYAEALYDHQEPYGSHKSNRNDVEGKDFFGVKDSLTSNGGKGQTFTPFNFRTFRYIRLSVHTKDAPIVIDSLYGTFTGYPFKQTALFKSEDTVIPKILDIGWRTARLNAFETYTDCPFYEQLQYIGDTRIQAMISYYYSGDDRLARHALDLMDQSRLPEGVTLSRYPTHTTQVISTFSLWYIGMLHDFFMYRHDNDFIKDKLPGVRGILDFFSKYQLADGSLANTPYWNFVDWASGKDWNGGAPPKGSDGSSAIVDMQLLWAYQWAAQMETTPTNIALYNQKAAQLTKTIKQKYWDAGKGIFADTKEKDHFSQHANSLAILTGLVNKADLPVLSRKLLSDATLTQCSIYFKYYLHQALVKAGMGDDYINWLGIWKENIAMGLTTWAEYSDVGYSRSDCHAWGSSPNIEFFRTVLGIDSDAPGFSKIKIEPHLGNLKDVNGEMLHPFGKISVSYVYKAGQWNLDVQLPANTAGVFIWKGKSYVIKAGNNKIRLQA